MAQMVGGIGEEKEMIKEVGEYCEQVKAKIEEKCSQSFDFFEPCSWKSQVVAGTNYFVKIKVNSNGDCVHVRIFQPLPHTGGALELSKVQTKKTADDAIEYF